MNYFINYSSEKAPNVKAKLVTSHFKSRYPYTQTFFSGQQSVTVLQTYLLNVLIPVSVYTGICFPNSQFISI